MAFRLWRVAKLNGGGRMLLASRAMKIHGSFAYNILGPQLAVLPVSVGGRFYHGENQSDVTVTLRQGFPVVTVPLPSRKELCEFTLRPHLQTLQDFLTTLRAEDRGIDRAVVYSLEGNKVAQSTGIDLLLQTDFDLEVNDVTYRIKVPEETKFPLQLEGESSLADVRNMIHKLYTSLSVDRHQLEKERELRGQLEQLKCDLLPMEDQMKGLLNRSGGRTNWTVWLGMAYMSVQFGFFARLTWWDYSWDIMEPVTYFATYAGSMAMFGYFLLTRQEYLYPDARDRIQLSGLHKAAKKQGFDIDRYNHLKDTVAKIEGEIKRLHDPLQLNLPTPNPDGLLDQFPQQDGSKI